jgi:hypothetical protein
LSDDLFLCQVSKGSAVWSEFNIFCTLVTMATAAILNFINPSKATTLRWIFLQSLTKFDEKNKKKIFFFFNPPFLAYLVPLDVDVVPIKFHQFLFGE